MDSFTETSSQGWFGRIGQSIKGLLVGFIASVASVFLLFWNEGRAVQTAKSLKEGSGAVVSISADQVDAANDGKLVHISGEATTDETLSDEEFNISEQALRLERLVEMYQWEEDVDRDTRKKFGGGTETTTTYSYEEVWSDELIDSNSFNEKHRARYPNPDRMAVPPQTLDANKVTVGNFTLSPSLQSSIQNSSSISVSEDNIPQDMAEQMTVLDQETLYYGEDSQEPRIGDCRVRFVVTLPAIVSVIAEQTGDTFQPYQTEAGDALSMLRMDMVSADQMFAMAQADNRAMTWMLRGIGAVVMFIGLYMFTKPITVLADVIPIFGNIAEMGFMFVCGMLTLAGSSLVIGIAWVYYRPLVGIPLIGVAIGAIVMLFLKRKKGPATVEALPTGAEL